MKKIEKGTRIRKSLRIKIFLSIVLTLILLFLSYQLISTYLIQKGYADLELKDANEDVNRTLEALQAETNSLKSKAGDWANWDDAYDFVKNTDANADFITTNIGDTSFEQIGVNLILFASDSGKIVYSKEYDLKEYKEIPVSHWWQMNLFPGSKFIQTDPDKTLSGIIIVEDQPMLVAVHPVLRSNGEGPAAGTLIFGRYLDDVKINELAKREKYALTIDIYNNLSPGFQAAGLHLSETDPIWVYPKDSRTMLGYALINNIFGQPAVILQETFDREVYDFGLKSTRIITLVFLVFCITLIIVVMFILEKQVLSRLLKLQSEIKMIGTQGSLSARVKDFGADELGNLAQSVNESLEKFETISKQVEGQTHELRKEKETTERLNNDLLKFQLAVENASDNIVITDQDGIIIYANKAIQKNLGYTPEEVLGKKAGTSELWGGLMQQEFYEKLWDTIGKQKKTFIGEVNERQKDGRASVVQLSITPILDKNGKVKFYVAIGHDITKIREADKMKDEFLSIASHELRTPMTVIKGYTSLLMDGTFGALTDIQKQHIETIEKNVTGLISLVNDMLDINKLEAGSIEVKIENIDPDIFVAKILEEFSVLFEKKNISLSFTNKIPVESQRKKQIAADPYLLRRILTNLLSNAYKFTPNDGKVEIISEQYSQDPKFLLISVKDNGPGIPPEKLDKVFVKFSQINTVLQREQGGTGLGLAIVKRMVEALKGKVWVESIPKQGSVFSFLVPFTQK